MPRSRPPGDGEKTESAPYRRFLQSLKIDREAWHDGLSYDLAALSEISAEERAAARSLLLAHRPLDTRDIAALAELARLDGDDRAIRALRKSLRGKDRTARLAAAEALLNLGRIIEIGPIIAEALLAGEFGDGLSEAEDLAQTYPGPEIIDALLKGALSAKDDRGPRFAGLLFYLHGLAEDEFDWNERPFFLRFLSGDPGERRAAFQELCRRIGVDSAPYIA